MGSVVRVGGSIWDMIDDVDVGMVVGVLVAVVVDMVVVSSSKVFFAKQRAGLFYDQDMALDFEQHVMLCSRPRNL